MGKACVHIWILSALLSDRLSDSNDSKTWFFSVRVQLQPKFKGLQIDTMLSPPLIMPQDEIQRKNENQNFFEQQKASSCCV